MDIGRPCRSCAVAEEVTIMGWIPDVKTWREAVFTGHFGPMGIGAIFISTLANEFLHEHVASHPSTTTDSSYQRHQIEMVMDMIQPIVAFMVLFPLLFMDYRFLGLVLESGFIAFLGPGRGGYAWERTCWRTRLDESSEVGYQRRGYRY